ncbi:MAG: uroporphyrinogen decarboxylase family protein [Thermoleophilia bacterium]
MGKQAVLDAYEGKYTPVVPWVPYVGVHGAFLIGETATTVLQDADLLAKAVLNAADRYKADGIPLVFDLAVEAMSMGIEAKWFDDNPPTVIVHPLLETSLADANLKVPGPTDGRWPIIIEAGKKVKAQLGDVALIGLACGPLTLASHLRGAKIFTDMVRKPELALEILEFAAKVCAESARIYAEEIGCDIVALVEPVGSQIRGEMFDKFVIPACQAGLDAIHAAGKVSALYICGDATKIVENMMYTGASCVCVDEQLNMNYVRDCALKYGRGFGGNLKLTLALSLGIIDPREDAIVSLAAGGKVGYTFSPG